jgi:hypothetical protein
MVTLVGEKRSVGLPAVTLVLANAGKRRAEKQQNRGATTYKKFDQKIHIRLQ